jgi:hypothetical protein
MGTAGYERGHMHGRRNVGGLGKQRQTDGEAWVLEHPHKLRASSGEKKEEAEEDEKEDE